MTPTPPDEAAALEALADIDRDLALVLERIGPPPRWQRPPGFATLVHIILEQQVSLASAAAAFARLGAVPGAVEPAGFLALDDATLRDIGFSRQKAGYARDLAAALADRRFDLGTLATMPDAAAAAALEHVRGVGPWTSAIYLMMVLRRPDVWPVGDLALVSAVQDVKGFDHRPTAGEMAQIAEPWRPHRSLAARLLWHHYLS